jgi:hypothetical protein
MKPKDPEILALSRIIRVIGAVHRFLSPEGRRWLRDRLLAVELRDVA